MRLDTRALLLTCLAVAYSGCLQHRDPADGRKTDERAPTAPTWDQLAPPAQSNEDAPESASLPEVEAPTPDGSTSNGDWKGALKGHLCFIPEGTQRLSDVGYCKPEGILYANHLNVSPRRFTHGFPGISERFEWFAFDFKGKFTTTKAGEYAFRLHSDDGAILWINRQIVVDNDGLHPPLSKTGTLHLTEGEHSIRVFYFQGPRDALALQLFVTPPGGTERLWTSRI